MPSADFGMDFAIALLYNGPSKELPDDFYGIGRARRGVSGTLYSQSAIARRNSFSRVVGIEPLLSAVVLKVWSHANGQREPGQAGNGAAISELVRCAVDSPNRSQ